MKFRNLCFEKDGVENEQIREIRQFGGVENIKEALYQKQKCQVERASLMNVSYWKKDIIIAHMG